jgi:raffinose/stachyose/melibiose transport system permease protein
MGYLFVLPAGIVYLMFILYPFVTSLQYSLTDWDGAQPVKQFIGLDNYIRMAGDPSVWRALWHNTVFIVLGTFLVITISLFIAVLISRARFRLLLSAIFFLPVLLSTAIVGLIWGWIYHPNGLLNSILDFVGLADLTRGWLGDADTALVAVIVAATWGAIGFNVVIFLAAIRNVDQDLIDAAYIDGAGARARFVNVTLPQIKGVLTTVVILAFIGGFTAFDIVYTMTGGGPAGSTELIANYGYRKAFRGSEVGYGAAVSTLITALALGLSLIYLRLRHDED